MKLFKNRKGSLSGKTLENYYSNSCFRYRAIHDKSIGIIILKSGFTEEAEAPNDRVIIKQRFP